MTDTKTTGTVTSAHGVHKSYLVSGPQGKVRNIHRHLVRMATDNSGQTHEHAAGQGAPQPITTRSGITKPDQLDLLKPNL